MEGAVGWGEREGDYIPIAELSPPLRAGLA